MATTGGTDASCRAWCALYKSGSMCMVVRPLKSIQYWPNATFKHLLSTIAEGMVNADSPDIHSMLCISIHNTSDFSDKITFPIERLDYSIE
jgi:hypothetical protein